MKHFANFSDFLDPVGVLGGVGLGYGGIKGGSHYLGNEWAEQARATALARGEAQSRDVYEDYAKKMDIVDNDISLKPGQRKSALRKLHNERTKMMGKINRDTPLRADIESKLGGMSGQVVGGVGGGLAGATTGYVLGDAFSPFRMSKTQIANFIIGIK